MDKEAFEIANKIKQLGGRVYLVGGAVRDEIMEKEAHDRDYCITGIEVNQFVELFPKAKLIGNSFPVFLLNECEYAFARAEEKISQGYKGFAIHTSKDITIEDDLKRRDLTINAIAKDVLTGEIIDPFGGINDILSEKIRHVSNAFCEDPLRVYRAARFAAKYNFEVVPETIGMMKNLRDELYTISAERVFEELRKVLKTDNPDKFFEVLKEAELLDVHFKEINDLIGVPQLYEYHPEGDVFNHTMLVLKKVSEKTEDESVRFAALVHDLGKAKTPSEILPRHIGHEISGIELVKQISKRLKLPTIWKQIGIEAVKYHMKAGIFMNMRPYKQAVFFNKISKSKLGLNNLEIIANADNVIGRKEIKFADLANFVINEVNGKKLINRGITPESIGIDKFTHMILEEQAKIIKEIEEK